MSNLTLHAAMEVVLKEKGPLTPKEIAREIYRRDLYQRGDSGVIPAGQISARANNYEHLFIISNGTIQLRNTQFRFDKGDVSINSTPEASTVVTPLTSPSIQDKHHQGTQAQKTKTESTCINDLMSDVGFISARDIDDLVPDKPGMYCIRILRQESLPPVFTEALMKRNHNVIYIGIATESLKKRLLNQELRSRGHGTFFRSIGAVLGFKPPKGSLRGKANKRNYKFATADSEEIIEWINSNLLVKWVTGVEDMESKETEMIRKFLPLLNIQQNPFALSELQQLRKECVEIALG